MRTTAPILGAGLLLLSTLTAALPKIPFMTGSSVIQLSDTHVPVKAPSSRFHSRRQAATQQPCFIIGDQELPAETQRVVDGMKDRISCSTEISTIEGVPDVTCGSMTYSKINFHQTLLSPLNFSLIEFATLSPLKSNNLSVFQDALNVYEATQAGLRSMGGTLTIKQPTLFLQFQISRIMTAQGNPPTDDGLQVDHLLQKILKNANGADPVLIDQVKALATQLE